MAYAIEAIRWSQDRTIESVRWHSFTYEDGDLKKGASEVRSMHAVAVAAARGHDLYLCYQGTVGRRLDVIELPNGRKSLADRPTGDQQQTIGELPTF